MLYAFISRHTPTPEQEEIVRRDLEGELVHVGDINAFNCSNELYALRQQYKGVIVVHAAMALQAYEMGFLVGVFQNANRAPEGAVPTFTPLCVHLWCPPPR
jgi:hypothetical protein